MKKSRQYKSGRKQSKPIQTMDRKQELDQIFDSRKGGAINIRGLSFQLLYACNRVLLELTESSPGKKVRLEGIEDVDVLHIDRSEFIQLKTSVNAFDAGKFWDLGVLQNFLKVYEVDPVSKLILVHNTTFAKGHLANLANKTLTQSDIDYWTAKLKAVADPNTNIPAFLSSISFQKESDNTLASSCFRQLIEKFNLGEGNYLRYFQALHHNVFLWSRDRKTIAWEDLQNMVQEVTDSFSKSPSNPAIKYNWTKKISFDHSVIEDESYFDGKAARPHHITQKLPVRRTYWEKQIKDDVESFDITVIRSSSGQGKSTLAWCVAKDFSDSDFSIYELQYCEGHAQVAGLYDFFITRLKIGEKPVLVIDGLNSSVINWSKLIEQFRGIPIKIIVTTRQEDWYRYGADASRIRLKVVDIFLSMDEAKEIFQQLKSKGKINSSIPNWEPMWEAIEEQKLLIEYVFLLTRGEMIAERISYQIKELNRETGAAAKIEILRLISLADTLNIRISTSRLTEFIQSTIRFDADRGEVYKQLENEYYLKFDSEYVEGLHPIRSQHLVDVLHETISLKDTLVSVFRIIEQNNVFDFFANLALNIDPNDIKGLYESIAVILSDKNFGWKVKAIDGLLYYDVHRYWLENKQAFDEVFATGALDLFVMDMVPFNELGILNDLAKVMPDGKENGPMLLYERKKEFTSFKLKDTETAQFVTSILDQLPDSYQSFDNYESLSFLVGWVVKLGIEVKKKLPFDEKTFMSLAVNSQTQELLELSNYFNTIKDEHYIRFCKTHKSELFSLLKTITDSVTLEEKENDIIIKYLLKDEEIAKSNEASVSRIETIFTFLPNYDKYCTEAIVLPFPNIESYKIVLMNAEKSMPPKNIGVSFDVHLNQIWRKTIIDKYRASSSFEWQDQITTSRKFALEFVKLCTRYFEAEVENNTSRIKSTLDPLTKSAIRFFEHNKTKQDYPSFRKALKIEPIDAELKKIESWSSSMRNFSTQFFLIVKPNHDNARNVSYRNLESVVDNLPQMQQAFDRITDEFTAKYIDVEQLKIEEREWYRRLFLVVQYYIEVYIKSKGTARIQNAKNQLENWLDERNSNRLNQLHSIIKSFNDSYFDFHLPNQIIEKEKRTYAIIGVDYIEPGIEEDVINLSIGLRKFSQLDIDNFIFVNVINNGAISAFQCHKNYFERVDKCIETEEEFDPGVYGNPLPVNLEDVSLYVLEHVYIKPFENPKENTAYVKMMYDVWRIQKYRDNMDSRNVIEQKWLEQKELSLKDNIQSYLTELEHFFDENKYNLMNNRITDFLENKITISEDEIVNELLEWNQEINDSLLIR